ncbi:hypothetical protein [Paenibacillus ginsengarvi]|uniref:hypothetical protein n=1 Tax=Paenibacillus ginsengarvi TaxID=400777 RepID=UPI001876B33E|nr:hypothetical protein [Paenibacillus ginsengarvi]
MMRMLKPRRTPITFSISGAYGQSVMAVVEAAYLSNETESEQTVNAQLHDFIVN